MRDILENSIIRILADHVNTELHQQAEGGTWSKDLWEVLLENGISLALVGEKDGGVGLSWPDVFPMIFNCGKYCLPLPISENMLANWLLNQAGIEIPEGIITIAEPAGKNLAIQNVPWGRFSDYIVTEMTVNNQAHIALLKIKQKPILLNLNLARESRDSFDPSSYEVVTSKALPNHLKTGFIRLYGALMRSAQCAGATERLLEQSVQYATERVQFGKPISKFQAIQHQIAVLGCESAAQGAAANHAFETAGNLLPELAIASAKVRCSESAGKSASIAHAVHGAMGFTYEHTLHYASRRLWSWRSEFGTHHYWATAIGKSFLRSEQDFWPVITSNTLSIDINS